VLAEGKPGLASRLPYFQDTLHYLKYGQHGKAGHALFDELLKDGKQIMARDTPYYRDT